MGGPAPALPQLPTIGQVGGAISGGLQGAGNAVIGAAQSFSGIGGAAQNAVQGFDTALSLSSTYGGQPGGYLYQAREYFTKSDENAASQYANNANVAASEAYNRGSIYQDFTGDSSLDPQTMAELKALYASGASSADIAAALNKARKGKGIYAVRQIRKNIQSLKADIPGRSQILSISKKQQQQQSQASNTLGSSNALAQAVTVGKK